MSNTVFKATDIVKATVFGHTKNVASAKKPIGVIEGLGGRGIIQIAL